MQNTTFQLTIRGLNKETKAALTKKASQEGISLNKLALKTLQDEAGINTQQNRYHALKQFLASHATNLADQKAFDDALVWADKSSKEKQRTDEHDNRI